MRLATIGDHAQIRVGDHYFDIPQLRMSPAAERCLGRTPYAFVRRSRQGASRELVATSPVLGSSSGWPRSPVMRERQQQHCDAGFIGRRANHVAPIIWYRRAVRPAKSAVVKAGVSSPAPSRVQPGAECVRHENASVVGHFGWVKKRRPRHVIDLPGVVLEQSGIGESPRAIAGMPVGHRADRRRHVSLRRGAVDRRVLRR
jgi:hypothetical protein